METHYSELPSVQKAIEARNERTRKLSSIVFEALKFERGSRRMQHKWRLVGNEWKTVASNWILPSEMPIVDGKCPRVNHSKFNPRILCLAGVT